MRRFGLVIVLSAGALSLGCSNDDNGGKASGPKNSGVEPKTLLTSLTQPQVYQLCAFERDTYKASLTSEYQYCFRVEVEDATSCQSDLNGCLGSGDYEDELQDDWDCENLALKDFLQPRLTCSATVAQFEACERALQKQQRDYYAKADCEKPESLRGPVSEPEACVELHRVCPSLRD